MRNKDIYIDFSSKGTYNGNSIFVTYSFDLLPFTYPQPQITNEIIAPYPQDNTISFWTGFLIENSRLCDRLFLRLRYKRDMVYWIACDGQAETVLDAYNDKTLETILPQLGVEYAITSRTGDIPDKVWWNVSNGLRSCMNGHLEMIKQGNTPFFMTVGVHEEITGEPDRENAS